MASPSCTGTQARARARARRCIIDQKRHVRKRVVPRLAILTEWCLNHGRLYNNIYEYTHYRHHNIKGHEILLKSVGTHLHVDKRVCVWRLALNPHSDPCKGIRARYPTRTYACTLHTQTSRQEHIAGPRTRPPSMPISLNHTHTLAAFCFEAT